VDVVNNKRMCVELIYFKYFLNDRRGKSKEILLGSNPKAIGLDKLKNPKHKAT
jgi:hypothetical protein